MNRGIMLKAMRETWAGTLLFGAGLFFVEVVLGFALPTLERQLGEVFERLGFVQQFLRALVGMDVAGQIGPEVFSALRWVHPVVLALVWAHAITFCTRVPVGEVDRGTIDALMGLPVSRWGIFISESLVWVAATSVVLLLGLAGGALGGIRAAPHGQPSVDRVAIALINLLCLSLAVGASAWLVSALSERRGRAIGVVFAVVLSSFLLTYLAQLWKPAERLSFLSVLHYYRPMFILRDGAWPVKDLSVLACTTATLWLTAGVVFVRRDLSA